MVKRVGVVLGVLAGSALVACNGAKEPAVPTAGPSTGEAFGGVQCTAVRPQTEPDLMAWDSGSRATLRAVKEQGVVVVRYEAEGCNVQLHVLPNCVATGGYTFSPYSATETKLARTANELFAELPVGAANLAAKIKGTHAIRTDYMISGVESLKIGSTFKPEELVGDCGGATHVVSKIFVGGFALAAGETRDLEGRASVFVVPAVSVGGGARSESAVEHLQHEGSAKACEQAQEDGKPSAQCSVPLRIALMALGAQTVACPTGSTWDGKQCMRKDVVTEVQCPAGTKWDGSKCAASVDTNCGSGLHFEQGRGCIPAVAQEGARAVSEDFLTCEPGMAWFVDKCIPCGQAGVQFRQKPVLGSPTSDAAAQCSFEAILKKYSTTFSNSDGYTGAVLQVLDEHSVVLGKARAFDAELESVVTTFQSKPWTVAVRTRQGAAYDNARTRLYNTLPPRLKYFTEAEERALGRLNGERADEARTARKELWRSKKDSELMAADTRMVARYAAAVAAARGWKAGVRWKTPAHRRLAYFTNILGDDKMRSYLSGTYDPVTHVALTYVPGMYSTTLPGQVVSTSDVRVRSANHILASGDPESAAPAFAEMLKSSPEDVASHLGLAECERMRGHVAEAWREYSWLAQKAPNLREMLYDRGLFALAASSIPGLTARDQADLAVESFTRYRSLRDVTTDDDVEFLIGYAQARRSELTPSSK